MTDQVLELTPHQAQMCKRLAEKDRDGRVRVWADPGNPGHVIAGWTWSDEDRNITGPESPMVRIPPDHRERMVNLPETGPQPHSDAALDDAADRREEDRWEESAREQEDRGRV